MGGSAPSPRIVERKRAMRQQALARRAGLMVARLSQELVDSLLRHVAMPPGSTVAGVWPLPGEPDLRPLLSTLHGRGCTVVLPETTPRGHALRFRRWRPGCAMLAGRFATTHPEGDLVVPDIVLVPLLAFDGAGHRLGYGGGYYDRTLASLPHCRSVGFGLEAQRVDGVPVEPHDRALDMIVTERGAHVPIHRPSEHNSVITST